MNNQNISKLQFRQYQEIRINKHIFLYFYIAIFTSSQQFFKSVIAL